MSIETRIGVVAGLLIVVVASVYFLYGNDPNKEEFLLSAGPKVSLKPAIPTGGEEPDKPADSGARRASTEPGQAGGSPPEAPASTRKRAAQGRRPQDIRIARTDGRRSRPAANRRRPAAPPGRHQEADGRRGASQLPRSSTALRSGPAPELVEATRENAETAEPAPSAESGADLATLAGRIRAARRDRGSDGTDGTGGASGTAKPVAPARRPRTTPPAKPPAPDPVSWPQTHKIADGDTLFDLAVRYYGDSRLTAVLLKANPHIKNPRALPIGDVLTIPSPRKAASASPADKPPTPPATSGKTYLVKKGNSFYSIARALYGDPARWKEIFELNRQLVKNDPKTLRAGMVIALP